MFLLTALLSTAAAQDNSASCGTSSCDLVDDIYDAIVAAEIAASLTSVSR